MAIAHTTSAWVNGLQVMAVELEVDIQPGLPLFLVVGLSAKEGNEMRSRVTAAIKNSGFSFPLGKITVNMTPSGIRKQGTGFDLAIALSILQASKAISEVPQHCLVCGELSLDGTLKQHTQALSLLLYAATRQVPCMLPRQNGAERKIIPEASVVMVDSLREAVTRIAKPIQFECQKRRDTTQKRMPHVQEYLIDQIKAQSVPKRVLEIALAGNHHLFLSGPPGSGKTMLARAAIELLPPLSRKEELEVLQVQALAGQYASRGQRPLRSPLPSISGTGLFGGGVLSRPGEISLAHHGILFLDEFSQLDRSVSEALRMPMEEKQIILVRQGQETRFPADCLIITAENACGCGLKAHEGEECRCTHSELLRYNKRHSEALLDRFELFCLVPRINFSQYSLPPEKKGKEIAEDIARVREVQKNRGRGQGFSGLSSTIQEYMLKATQKYYISARGMEIWVRVAQTITDLEGGESIELKHVQEALQYRRRLEW